MDYGPSRRTSRVSWEIYSLFSTSSIDQLDHDVSLRPQCYGFAASVVGADPHILTNFPADLSPPVQYVLFVSQTRHNLLTSQSSLGTLHTPCDPAGGIEHTPLPPSQLGRSRQRIPVRRLCPPPSQPAFDPDYCRLIWPLWIQR